jgi:hypothetical protein
MEEARRAIAKIKTDAWDDAIEAAGILAGAPPNPYREAPHE